MSARPEALRHLRGGRLAVVLLAIAAVAAAIASLVVADGQERGNLQPPSIAVDDRGLSSVVWTEVARPGIRIARELEPGRWSQPRLLDRSGGPGEVVIDRDRLAHVAYVGSDGLVVADQLPGRNEQPSLYRRQVLDRQGFGRPAIAISNRGDTAVLYEAPGGLRVALRGRSGEWQTRSTGISASEPRLSRWGVRGFTLAGLRGDGVVLGRLEGSGSLKGRAIDREQAVASASPLRDFDLATSSGRTLLSYVQNDPQIVVVARPDEGRDRASVVATTAGIGELAAVAGAPDGRAVVLFRDARFRIISLAVLQNGERLGDLAVGQGQSGDVAMSPDGSVAHLAYWDPGGRQVFGARVPLNGPQVPLSSGLFAYSPTTALAGTSPISVAQLTLPQDGKTAIGLAALTLLLVVAAGGLSLLERRRGIRLLPFGIVLLVLCGFAVRAVYIAEVGIYGLPPNDLLILDRDGVSAVVDALLIVSATTAVLCLVGRLLPVGWNGPMLQRLRAVQLPSQESAVRVVGAFLFLSLAVAAYLLRDSGIESLLESRQTAFANRGYQLVLLSAGAAAWLVLLALSGWPARRRDQVLLVISGILATVPLLLSGARSVVVLGFAAPIVLLIHLRVRPIRLRTAAIGLVFLIVFAVGMRELTRGGTTSPYLADATPTEESSGLFVRAMKPVVGWTEAAGIDALVLVRTEYVPQFGTDPLLTPGAFLGIPVPRSLWSNKPRSAMDTFTERLNPWNYSVSKVGQTTTLAGELTMNWGLVGVFAGFAAFGLLLCLLGELLAAAGGIVGILVAIALVPRVGAAVWGDSFNAGWGGIALAVMIGLAIVIGNALSASDSQPVRALRLARRNEA